MNATRSGNRTPRPTRGQADSSHLDTPPVQMRRVVRNRPLIVSGLGVIIATLLAIPLTVVPRQSLNDVMPDALRWTGHLFAEHVSGSRYREKSAATVTTIIGMRN